MRGRSAGEERFGDGDWLGRGRWDREIGWGGGVYISIAFEERFALN